MSSRMAMGALASCAFCAGCFGGDDGVGGGGGGGGDDGRPSVSAGTYIEEICALWERCDIDDGGLIAIESCVEGYERLAGISLEENEAIEALAPCASRLRSVDCAEVQYGIVDIADEVFDGCLDGFGARGDPCGSMEPCRPGLQCDAEGSSCGTCRAAEEITCEFRFDCPGRHYCADGTCVAQLPDGMSCDDDEHCLSDRCEGTCVRALRVGDACSGDVACPVHLDCVGSLCEGRASIGEACEGGFGCALPWACHEGVCVEHAATDNPVGGPCSFVGACVAGAFCRRGTCIDGPGIDEPCDEGECGTGYCDGATCQPGMPAGAACVDDQECQSDECIDGACVDELPVCAP